MHEFVPPPPLTVDEVERLEHEHPSDRITGHPDHYIINGDTSSCGCLKHRNGHSRYCEVRNIPYWKHDASVCDTRRQLCTHLPSHTYGQACDDYHEPSM